MLRIFQTRLCLRQMSVMTLTFKRVPTFGRSTRLLHGFPRVQILATLSSV